MRMHLYERSPHSGAGNCRCGHPPEARLHPHPFTPMAVNPMRCVCVKPPNWHGHRAPSQDEPTYAAVTEMNENAPSGISERGSE